MVSLAPCADMEPESGDTENKALDPGEPAVMRTSPVLADSKGLQVDTHMHREGTGVDVEELQEGMVVDEENKEAKVGPENEDETEKDGVVDNKEEQDMDHHSDGMDDECVEPTTSDGTTSQTLNTATTENHESDNTERQKLRKTPSFGKTVRFSETEEVEERDISEESLFPDYELEEWTSACFEELFMGEDWIDITGKFPAVLRS